MHDGLIGSHIRFMEQESPGCVGAAISPNGGSIDANRSVVLTMYNPGVYHLCFAEAQPGVRWILPVAANATRRRSLQGITRLLVDDDFEYLSHVLLVVNATLAPSPPSGLLLLADVAENQSVEFQGATGWGFIVLSMIILVLLWFLCMWWLRRKYLKKPKEEEYADEELFESIELKVQVDKELAELRRSDIDVEIEQVPPALERARSEMAAKEAAMLRRRREEAAVRIQKHARGNAARLRVRKLLAQRKMAEVPDYMLDRGPNPFVCGLRVALGLDDTLEDPDALDEDDTTRGFNGDLDDVLRSLFAECDIDQSGELSRGEFHRALRILNLDKYLAKYGGERGVVISFEQLFDEFADKQTELLSSRGFVVLFRKLNHAEEVRHAQVWTRIATKHSPRSQKWRAAAVKADLAQDPKITSLSRLIDSAVVKESEEVLNFADGTPSRMASSDSHGRLSSGSATSIAAKKELERAEAAHRQKDEYSELKSLMKQLSPSQRSFKKLQEGPSIDKGRMRQLSLERSPLLASVKESSSASSAMQRQDRPASMQGISPRVSHEPILVDGDSQSHTTASEMTLKTPEEERNAIVAQAKAVLLRRRPSRAAADEDVDDDETGPSTREITREKSIHLSRQLLTGEYHPARVSETEAASPPVSLPHRSSGSWGRASSAVASGELFKVFAPGGPLGLGLVAGSDGCALVADVQDGSTVGAVGVTVGCRLVSVNGRLTKGLSMKEVTELLRASSGHEGLPRTLEFARAA